MKEFSYEDIEASTKGFSVDRLIGKGSHGSVYRGTLPGGQEIAIKKPSEGLQSIGEGSKKLDEEIKVLSSIPWDPNVVNLLGVSHGPSHKLIVMEFMPNGSLHDLLHSSPAPPPWPRRMLLALQVARAVLFLHEAEPPIVHRDIKSANILFDRRWNARLADFSLAVIRGPVSIPAAGTLGYLDPCYTAPGKLGPKNDVFSFGVVLLELVSARRAMDVVAWAVPMIRERRMEDVCDGRVALHGRRMRRGIGRMLGIAERCVSEDEERRPGMREVVGELEVVVERSWGSLRSGVCGRVNRCVGAWRRWKERRVTTATMMTKVVVCRDHLVDGDDDDDDL